MTAEQQDLRVGLARLEGKVDAALTGHGSRLEVLEISTRDQETRLRGLELRPVVAPRHIYAGVVLACMILGAVVSILTIAG